MACRLDEQFDKLRHDDGKGRPCPVQPGVREFKLSALLVSGAQNSECAKATARKA